jgi:hypothetical protein
MNNTKSPNRISRVDFLKLLALSGAAAGGGYALSFAAPWLDYEDQAAQTWTPTPIEMDTEPAAKMRSLVYYATLAANGHNTQPWKFAIRENSIDIHPDYTRSLPVVDPHDRALWISLGCALENLVVSARSMGYAAEVTYPGDADFITVRLTADTPQDSPLFKAIPLRQNTRSEYDGRLVKNADFETLQVLPLEEKVTLRFLSNPADMGIAQEYVYQGNLAQYVDSAFVDELIFWLRFNKKEALSDLDGLYSGCSGTPQVPRWLGQMFVSGMEPQQQADTDLKKLRTSPSAVVLGSTGDDKTAWVQTGQVYERLALQMTLLDVKSAFLNQPIEVPALRAEFQTALSLGDHLPQLLIRFGYAEAMPRSLRRPVNSVLI